MRMRLILYFLVACFVANAGIFGRDCSVVEGLVSPDVEPDIVEGFWTTFHLIDERYEVLYPDNASLIWNSWGPSNEDLDENRLGKWVSDSFQLSDKLSLYLLGYPCESCEVLLEQPDGEILKLRVRRDPKFVPHSYFRMVCWSLPKEWRNQVVKLTIRDISTRMHLGWFAFANPPKEFVANTNPAEDKKRFMTVFTYIPLHLLLFLIPGTAVLVVLPSSLRKIENLQLPLILVSSLVVPYVGFWLYWMSSNTGKIFSLIIYTLSLLILFCRAKLVIDIFRKWAVFFPFILVLLTAAFSWTSGMLEKSEEDIYHVTLNRYFSGTAHTPDNLLPVIFGDQLYFDHLKKPFFMDWHSSDRGPLQTAVYLMHRPFMMDDELQYHILGIILQSLVILGIYYLADCIFNDRWLATASSVACIFTAVTITQTFYVWPKLLAACLTFLPIAWAFKASKITHSNDRRIVWVLCGAGGALSILAHSGCFFALFPALIVFLLRRHFPKYQNWILVGFTFLILMGPWLAYKAWIDPPGNRLLKMHFAGVQSVDYRGLKETICDEFKTVTFKEWLIYRWENIDRLFPEWDRVQCYFSKSEYVEGAKVFKTDSYFEFFTALGMWNVGFPLLLLLVFWKRKFPYSTYFWIWTGGLLFWIITMFLPGETILHQGSYTLYYLALISLIIALIRYAPWVAEIVFILQALLIQFNFILSPLVNQSNDVLYSDMYWSKQMIVVNILLFIAFLFIFHCGIKNIVRMKSASSQDAI